MTTQSSRNRTRAPHKTLATSPLQVATNHRRHQNKHTCSQRKTKLKTDLIFWNFNWIVTTFWRLRAMRLFLPSILRLACLSSRCLKNQLFFVAWKNFTIRENMFSRWTLLWMKYNKMLTYFILNCISVSFATMFTAKTYGKIKKILFKNGTLRSCR